MRDLKHLGYFEKLLEQANSMMVTTIYNTADTFFVSKISVAASGATGIVFSLMAILQAFGFMLGHGAGSNISRLLGARKVANASVFLSTSFFLAIGTGFLIGLFGLLFLEPFLLLLGSTETILPEAKAYATFILLAAPAISKSGSGASTGSASSSGTGLSGADAFSSSSSVLIPNSFKISSKSKSIQ